MDTCSCTCSSSTRPSSTDRYARLVALQWCQKRIDDIHREEFRDLSQRYLSACIERVKRPVLRAIIGLVLRPYTSATGRNI